MEGRPGYRPARIGSKPTALVVGQVGAALVVAETENFLIRSRSGGVDSANHGVRVVSDHGPGIRQECDNGNTAVREVLLIAKVCVSRQHHVKTFDLRERK
jgi:hypothetical protein